MRRGGIQAFSRPCWVCVGGGLTRACPPSRPPPCYFVVIRPASGEPGSFQVAHWAAAGAGAHAAEPRVYGACDCVCVCRQATAFYVVPRVQLYGGFWNCKAAQLHTVLYFLHPFLYEAIRRRSFGTMWRSSCKTRRRYRRAPRRGGTGCGAGTTAGGERAKWWARGLQTEG